MNFDHIILLPEQKALLETIVEASRNVTPEQRQKFIFIQTLGGACLVHQGLDADRSTAFLGDLEALSNEGIISMSYNERSNPIFDVSPLGYKYYEFIRSQSEQSTDQVVESMSRYIESEPFRKNHTRAFKKWDEAQQRLWSPEVEKELTTIGHLCRESLQEFAETLVSQYLPDVELKDKAKTVSRIRAVISDKKTRVGKSKEAFLDALLVYWGTVSDLIQKQEHGAQAEHEQLTWEDARRVVFQTVVVMYEIDRALKM